MHEILQFHSHSCLFNRTRFSGSNKVDINKNTQAFNMKLGSIVIISLFTYLHHGDRLYMEIAYTWRSLIHGDHLYMEITYTWRSPLHGDHLYMEITFTWRSPIHGDHLYMEITYTWRSPLH